MTHLLALGSVKALEQSGDDAFLDGEFGFEGSDFRSKSGDLFLWSFDTFKSSNWHAYHEIMLYIFIGIHTRAAGLRRAGQCHQ
jgi:hypothetical protein